MKIDDMLSDIALIAGVLFIGTQIYLTYKSMPVYRRLFSKTGKHPNDSLFKSKEALVKEDIYDDMKQWKHFIFMSLISCLLIMAVFLFIGYLNSA